MSKETIEKTVKNNLCTSCGICKAVCPKKCIEYERNNDQYLPNVNKEQCIKCGLCLEMCPGISSDYKEQYEALKEEYPNDIFIGNYKYCLNAFSKNEDIRKNSTSGGIITSIVRHQLQKKKYNVAFLVDTFNYSTQVNVKEYEEITDYKNISKSRYVSVSQANLIEYMINNPEAKIIIVAVGCAVYGIVNVIRKYKLDRNNYLILGLFCDNSLSYNIFEYFNTDSQVKELYFRTKEKSGWPGNVKVILKDGNEKYYPANKRKEVKKYFHLERCLYCVDKLNQFADISIGDNYTEKNQDSKGSNSLIIRTQKGVDVIKELENEIEIYPVSFEEIEKSQRISDKKKQVDFIKAFYKDANINVCPDVVDDSNNTINATNMKIYKRKIKDINIGRNYINKPYKIWIALNYSRVINKIKRFIKNIQSMLLGDKKNK